jgi:hypothetical protein
MNDSPDQEPASPEPEWKRRRRLAAIFGDDVPEQTSDDKDAAESSGKGDDWYRDQVPPHHG